MRLLIKPLAGAAALALMAGCAGTVPLPDAQQVQTDAQARPAASWITPALPHGGSSAQLANWWTQVGDKLFDELMQAAQRESATLAAARTRIAQARAGVAGADRALLPGLNLQAQASRGVQQPQAPVANQASLGLQASWELDVWGANRNQLSAAQLRARGAELGWHEARVLVAAEMASQYMAYRYCENLLALLQRDAASREETARLAELTAKAGFTAPAQTQLARASSFDAANSLAATQAQCDTQVKGLVALSGMAEPELRAKLKQNQAAAGEFAARPALFSIATAVTTVPASLLTQRPDIAAAQDAVTAAALDARVADSRRYPALSLSGSVGLASVRQAGISSDGTTWSLGPVALTLPLTNHASTRANTEAAVAAYEEAASSLRAKVRQAVREVEESLVQLNATQTRSSQAQAAAQGYSASLAATQSRYRAGLASLVELEDARRTALFAQQSQLSVERERIAAWINLYRATGGGWSTASTLEAPVAAK